MKEINRRLKILLNWAKEDKKYIYLSILLGFLAGLLIMVPYMGIYNLINTIYTGTLTKDILLKLSISVSVSILVRYTLFTIAEILSHKGAYNTLFKIRKKLISHMSEVPLGELNSKNRGEIKKILNEDIEKLELFLAHHLPEVVMYLTGPLAVFVYLFNVNMGLALITLIPLPIAFYFQVKMFKDTGDYILEINDVSSNLNSTMIEYITGMRLIKSYNMTSSSFSKYKEACHEKSRLWKKISSIMGPNFASFTIFIEFGLLILIPIAGTLFLKEVISPSIFILFLLVGSLYLTEIRPLLEIGGHFSQVLSSVDKIEEILNLEVFVGGSNNFPQNNTIKFNKVNFSYTGEEKILKNINIFINEGQRTAIVGPSGSGKSTILGLVARFYDVDSGEILIGKENIKSIDYTTLLENIAIVFQKNFLTKESVFKNITMGKDYTLEEVREACKKAQIDDVIMKLPDQYETLVGGHDTRFSGGEQQRISIARAFLKDAPILILDEATSNTDPENQEKINIALNNLFIGKTVIIVAHRLSTIVDCDKIIVLENGEVTGVGKHHELISKNKYYSQVWDKYKLSRDFSYGKGDIVEE